MEEIDIHLEYLRYQDNQPTEVERRTIKCYQAERILRFRDKVAEAFNVAPTSIKLLNRGKLIDFNPMYSIRDFEIDQNAVIHVMDRSQRAPSQSRRRPQSSLRSFLPPPNRQFPNIIRFSNNTTLTELSVNRYVMQIRYQEPICPQGQLDLIVRTIAESFRTSYNVDVDVQRRNRQPYENDISFDISFRAPPIMPSGAYNRFEAIKSMLVRQKMLITLAEKHLISHMENPGAAGLPERFSETVLEELDKVEMYEIFSSNVFFLDHESNDKMNKFFNQFVSEIEEEVPLLGNVLQVRHLVPSDYYKLLDISASNNLEIQRLITIQRNLFDADHLVDTQVSDLFSIILRSLHHFQGHINHLVSEISLRATDSLRVAYPQSVLTTFSGLNPDLTFTIVFMGTSNNPNVPNSEMSSARFTSFHQVHIARPVLRADIAVEVEVQPVPHGQDATAELPTMANGQRNTRFRGIPPGMAGQRIRHVMQQQGRVTNAAPYINPQNIRPLRATMIPTPNSSLGEPSARRRMNGSNSYAAMAASNFPSFSSSSMPTTVNMPSTPAESNNLNDTPVAARTLRNFLQSMTGHPVELGTQGGQPVTLSSNDLLNPLNSVFRAVDPNSMENQNQSNPVEEGEVDVQLVGPDGSPGDNDDMSRILQAMVAQQSAFSQIRTNEPRNPNQMQNGIHNGNSGLGFPGNAHVHSHRTPPNVFFQQQGNHGIPIHAQRLQTSYASQSPQQIRNLGPSGGCPIAYYERVTPETLENHATSTAISTAITDVDLVACVQRYPVEGNILRRHMNEFALTSVESLEVLLKAYLQALVSYNSGRQIAHPAIINEVINQGHRIQLRRPSYRNRVIEFYRLMGSQDFTFIRDTLRSNSFLEDRGFLGTMVSTFLFSIKFDNIHSLILNPASIGPLRSSLKSYTFEKYGSENLETILDALKDNLYENYYHYLMGVAPFALTRNNMNMVGSLQNMDASMFGEFFNYLLSSSTDEEFGQQVIQLFHTYHSRLISFCYMASDGFPHAYREFVRHVFLDFPDQNNEQTNFAIDVFMESVVNFIFSFDNPNELKNIDTSNITEFLLASSSRFTPERVTSEAPLGSLGRSHQHGLREENIDTTVPSYFA